MKVLRAKKQPRSQGFSLENEVGEERLLSVSYHDLFT